MDNKDMEVEAQEQFAEESLDIRISRSVYERALSVDHMNITIWLEYTEMEMRHRHFNHARNLWDRAVTLLPRVNEFWYRYTYMEEILGNIPEARAVYERWMKWQPDEQAWQTYINFELQSKEIGKARQIYEQFVVVHPKVENWIEYSKFEENYGFIHLAHEARDKIVQLFGVSRSEVHNEEGSGIEVVVTDQKFQYEQVIQQNLFNYDAWIGYTRFLEDEGDRDITRETYERAIVNIPTSKQKQNWRRYIDLWMNFAIFEELKSKDYERTRQVYEACLDILPHKTFTFSKVWLQFANFEVRQKNVTAARRILAKSLETCPTEKLFQGYIDMELQLEEFDRCRKLYEQFIEFTNSENCEILTKFAELETFLGNFEQARAIYEFALNQTFLNSFKKPI